MIFKFSNFSTEKYMYFEYVIHFGERFEEIAGYPLNPLCSSELFCMYAKGTDARGNY